MDVGDDLSGWCQTAELELEPGNRYLVGVQWTDMPLGDQLRFFIPQDAGPYATDSGWLEIASASETVGNDVGPSGEGARTSLTVLYQPATPVTIGPYLGTLTARPSSPVASALPPEIPAFARWVLLGALETPAEVQVGVQCDDVPLGGDVRWIVQGDENDDIPSIDSGWQPIGDPNATITQQAGWPADARAVMGIYYRPSPTAQAEGIVLVPG